jgi:integrase
MLEWKGGKMSKRIKTDYKGVFYRIVPRLGGKGEEKSYFAVYKVRGKIVETAVGRQYLDDMTPAKAAKQRALLIEGKAQTREEERAAERQHKVQEEARQAEEAAQREQEENRPTLARLWEEFSTAKADKKSMNSEEGRWNLHLAPFLAGKMPSELVTFDVQRINKKMKNKNLSVMTRKHVLVLLKRIISYGVDMGRIDPPYSKKFKIDLKSEIGKVNNETTEDLSEDQLHSLLEAIQNAPDCDRQGADVMRLALATGMRKSEIFKLRWDEISFDRGNVRITNPKGGEDQAIPLNSTARTILESIPRVTIEGGPSPWVFPGKDPKRHIACIKRQINRIREAANLPEGFRPMHGLRHAYACALISSGKVDLPTLQKLLTHKSPAMTLRYAKVRDERLSNAAGVMDEILSNAQGGPGKVIPLDQVRQAQGG